MPLAFIWFDARKNSYNQTCKVAKPDKKLRITPNFFKEKRQLLHRIEIK